MQESLFKQKFIGLLLLTTVLFSNLSTFAQRRGGSPTPAKTSAPDGRTVAANQPKQDKRSGGYSGSVTYARTLTDSWTGKFGSRYDRKSDRHF